MPSTFIFPSTYSCCVNYLNILFNENTTEGMANTVLGGWSSLGQDPSSWAGEQGEVQPGGGSAAFCYRGVAAVCVCARRCQELGKITS